MVDEGGEGEVEVSIKWYMKCIHYHHLVYIYNVLK